MILRASPQPREGVLVLAMGLGQAIAFASSFYLMGVLGDAIGRDLRVATLMYPLGAGLLIALGASGAPLMVIGQGAGNGILTVAKGVLPLRLYGPSNYAYRSALLSRPAQFAQIAVPAAYGLLLERSAALALVASSALCLVMFAMTFGLVSTPQASMETAPA